ncbi:MAG: hypothetical protein H6977_14805 [Gammaproteobacteria bacterium]|nr:hypothetical protein [Gammaproteobacteria bacterium]MCP5201279.1 hypothetical protein [Gammaproteobacteria bacterium]
MNTLITPASTSSVSRPFVPERAFGRGLALLGAGLMLAVFHRALDLSLGLPGHFGVFWMAALVLARSASPLPAAALVTALGYLCGGAVLGAHATHGMVNAPGYLAAALCLDGAWWLAPALLAHPFSAALIGAVAFALKPALLAVAVAAFELKGGALRHGLGVVVLAHACFGGVGAVIGALLWQGQGRSPSGAREPH